MEILERVTRYLEENGAQVLDVRNLKVNGRPVITLDAKLPEGNVATFQIQGNILFRQRFNHKSKNFVTQELVYQFSNAK